MRFFGKQFSFVSKAMLWSFLLCLATYSALAQDLEKDNNDVPAPTPNLTLNIVLNSALDEQATQEYSKIAQEIISRLPRQIKVPSDLKNLSSNAAFDHMNVVAYFPKEDGQEADLDKLIKHFKVNFLFEGDDLNGGGYAMREVGEEGYVAVDPMQTRDGIKIAQTPNTATTAEDPADIAKDLLEGSADEKAKAAAAKEDKPVKQALEETKETTADSKQKTAKVADVEAVKAQPKPKSAVTTPPKTEKPAPVVAKAPEPKPAPKKEARKPKPKAVAKVAAPKIKLDFKMDDVFLDMENRRELASFAKELRNYKGKIAGYNIMIRSYFGPNGDQTTIGRERLERVITFLRQQDVDVTAGVVTEIHVQTLKDQFVSIEPVSEGQS